MIRQFKIRYNGNLNGLAHAPRQMRECIRDIDNYAVDVSKFSGGGSVGAVRIFSKKFSQ